MKLNNWLLVGFALISLSALALACYQLAKPQTQIVYVRSYDLIEGFQGTIDAKSKFAGRKALMLSNVDSLQFDFDRLRNQYVSSVQRLSLGERNKKERELNSQEEQLAQYREVIEKKIQEEDANMMQEVLNQVNSFIKEYAIAQHYDIVIGTTLSGNLLYGEQSLDVTDDLLKKLNLKYRGKK